MLTGRKRIKPLPSIATLHRLFKYDPITGLFFWKVNRYCGHHSTRLFRKAGAPAGTPSVVGYISLSVEKVNISAHRAAWAISYGAWPENEIDHINRIKSDNRLCNLREATHSQNGYNKVAQSNNVIGIKGISKEQKIMQRTGKITTTYVVHVNGKHIGRFPSLQAAIAVHQIEAKKVHGEFFHPTVVPMVPNDT